MTLRLSEKFTVDANGCWLWNGSLSPKGYGQAWDPKLKKPVRAHRYSYELANGPIPPGLVTDHLCRVSRCINPAHLEIVTPYENFLRGTSQITNNLYKTHCPKNHQYDANNTRRDKRGKRQCRLCDKAYHRRYYLLHAEEERAKKVRYRIRKKSERGEGEGGL